MVLMVGAPVNNVLLHWLLTKDHGLLKLPLFNLLCGSKFGNCHRYMIKRMKKLFRISSKIPWQWDQLCQDCFLQRTLSFAKETPLIEAHGDIVCTKSKTLNCKE